MKRHEILINSHRFQLMDDAVQPLSVYPLFVSKHERLTHVTLDTIATKLHDKMQIIFVATAQNLIKKITILPRTKETCVVEIWEPEVAENSEILTLQFLKQAESLYIGTENSIYRIPAQHCKRHGSKVNCLSAMDPYCGWNDLQKACTAPPENDPLKRFWIQQANECPITTSPIDGGFSSWSEWFKCDQHSEDHRHESSNIDSCLCRSRSCNNPLPKNGGALCKGNNMNYIQISINKKIRPDLPSKGPTISVVNCTLHGKWTEWGPWSACSQTCGVAVKHRRRSCGKYSINP